MTTEPVSKQQQFDEFFSIKHSFNVNISKLEPHQLLDFEHFVHHMPAPFKMAGEIASLDQATLKPLQALSGIAGQLVDYLNHQAQKIDLMMNYILTQQDEIQHRFNGTSFGGGGFTFASALQLEVGDYIEAKLFIDNDHCAVYSYAEVIDLDEGQYDEDDNKLYKAIFHFIRDEDREQLVRASLHMQSAQLQALAKQRRQQQSNN